MSENPTEYAAVVGTFDGVHRGHRYLIDDLRQRASQRGLATALFTFTDHPLSSLAPDRAPRLLTTVEEKLSLLGTTGIDRIDIKPFDTLASLTARQYIRHLSALGVRLLLIGYDNRFGSDGLTTLSQFVQAAHGTGVTVEQALELTTPDGLDINSSRIRRTIAAGEISIANDLLGYHYALTGTVVHGKQLGRTIGFPTANLQLPPDTRKHPVPRGVYACLASLHDGTTHPAMVNIGHRPTVDAPGAPDSIEAHIIGVQTDLYDTPLTLSFISRLRQERAFPSLQALQAQLAQDRRQTIDTIQSLNVHSTGHSLYCP